MADPRHKTQGQQRDPAAAPPSNLPLPSTPLIGREQEVAAASDCLGRDDVRLLTLTGPPGIGKTRLAIAVASRLATAFVHGVFFIDLAPVSDAHLVMPTIAHALGLRQGSGQALLTALQLRLSHGRVLLVLDNFEQVVEAAPALAELLQAAPEVKLLVTSRELLRISNEYTIPVPPLPVPPVLVDQALPRSLASVTPDRLRAYAAVQLFVQRTAAQQPGFALTQENALLVAGICCRLDGLPLALELAAARVRHLPLHAIYTRLAQGLYVLTGGARDMPQRQRTLRSAIAWSYDLLDASERRLFAQLAVFRGGCSLELAEVVCGGDRSGDLLNGLASLVDKSLVQQRATGAGEARFMLLAMIHEYARERLEASGEEKGLRSRHAAAMVELAERAEPELRRSNQKYWFELLEGSLDNLRAALEWSLAAGEVTAASRIISATFLYWIVYGRQTEGIYWVQRLLARLDAVAPASLSRLLRSATLLLIFRDREAAEPLARQAVTVARADGDRRELGWSLWALSTTLPSGPEADAVCEEALVLLREVDDQPGLGLVYNSIGERARLSGDHTRARWAYEQSLAIAEQCGDGRRQYYVLYNLAFVAQREGDHQQALRAIRRSLVLCRHLGVQTDVIQELLALAGSLAALGEPLRAAHLLGAAHAFLQRNGSLIDPGDQPEHERNMAFVRAQLGEAAYAAAWAEGQAMSFDQALTYAQTILDAGDLSTPSPQPDREGHGASDLTRREREVARLIAQGLSNRAIAEALVVSERTVEGHVSNILAKLGFHSRARIAAWVAGTSPPAQ